MKSIWLDEDQEVEKLYGGVRAQQFLGVDDDDEDMGIKVLNSDKPLLENKKFQNVAKYRTMVDNEKTGASNMATLHDNSGKKKKKFFGNLFNISMSKESRSCLLYTSRCV